MTNEVKEFIRYSNRKLYSKQTSKYVKLGDILRLTKDFQVIVKNKDGFDITNEILVQAIANLVLTKADSHDRFLALTKELITELT